jgi:hypothetical protein
MLHIANGDSIAGTLAQSSLPGEKVAFREDLTSGPTPAGLSTKEWIRLRAEFLKQECEPPARDCLQGLTDQQAALESHWRDGETVLWFGHDLNCQIHLINVLNLFNRLGPKANNVSLICIGEFPGIDRFICLGQLDAPKLESLFDSRREVTERELGLAARAWSAYSSNDPSDIEALLNIDTSALPFLAGALRLHLARFPSQRNGLGLIENWALQELSSGSQKFAPLFARFMSQYPAYGLGDAQFCDVLNRLADCPEPLIRITGVPTGSITESLGWDPVSAEITAVGLQVLAAEKDFVGLNGIDLWLGGVHLQSGKNDWRLDDETGKLVRIAA